MPEGDTIFRAAAQLRTALAGKELVALELRRDPRGRRPPEPGVMITSVESSGKHLLINFSDGQVLHTHMQMTGAWHVYATGARWQRPAWQARLVLEAGARTAVITAQPEGPAPKHADVVIHLRAQTMADDTGGTSVLPMGSLYEAAQLVFFDIVSMILRDRSGQTMDSMRSRHTNLE